jgi:citrate lyase subunit beta/citryl-CoA lyase
MSNAFHDPASATWRPRRSVLFVPAANERALAKIPSLDCDAVIIDLEDSVAPAEKANARERMRTILKARERTRHEIIVRINALDGAWGTEDLLAARAAGVDAILLPKVEDREAVEAAAAALDQTDAPASMRLWAMIETPLGILNLPEITRQASHSRLDCLVVGPNDLAKETGIESMAGRPLLVPLLMQVVVAAKAHRIGVLDGVYNDFRDLEGFAGECRQARAMGFDGKTLIHPSQIAPANAAFAAGDARLAAARAIVEAFARPENAAKGVIQLDGRMVERLHLAEAEALLAREERSR